MKRPLKLAACAALAGLAAMLMAQSRLAYSIVASDSGHVALGLALRKLGVTATFMQCPAHPDDESNALLALYARGLGLRTIDLQNNRGDGGQNEIGPELFHDMAVLRTSELLAAHRLDGAEQFFTRAIDYGYSFDPREVIAKWGRKEIVGDYVRFFRELRPDVVVTMNIQGRGGDRAHEATAILVREAWRISGDPSAYPEQIREGLRPWQPEKLYFSTGFGPPAGRAGGAQHPAVKLTPADTAAYDPLLGRTYTEIGADARSSHKCQGMGGAMFFRMFGSLGRRRGGYQLVESTIPGEIGKQETSLFEGIPTSLVSLARFAGPNPPAGLTEGLDAIAADAQRAQSAFAHGDDAGTAAPVEAGLAAVRGLRTRLASLGLGDSARYEIDFRLQNNERNFEDAILAAHDLHFEAFADDGLVIAGQPVKLSLEATNRGATPAGITAVEISGFDSPGRCQPGIIKKDAAFTCTVDARVPSNAKPTTPYFHDNYWKHPQNHAIQIFDPGVPFGVPFAPTPFRVTFHIKAGTAEIARDVPVQFRYVKDPFFGDKRMELAVVPVFSVRVTPDLAVFPAPLTAREIYVSVTNGSKGPAQATVALEAPAGWKTEPASAPLSFMHEDESQSARFTVTAPAGVPTGAYTLRAVATSPLTGSQRFTSGYQVIEYPHVERRQDMKPAEASLKVIDVRTAPGINVGYIVGVGDEVPAAIQQLGAKLSYIDADELAWGDLSKYDVIVTGVRAYERRADLRAYNRRLLDYVQRGGTVIVQYNKYEFNQEQYGPYPAKVSGNRVADETAPVKVLARDDPVFNFPNKIGPAAWADWVQERGLYFLGEKDKRYVDLVSMVDSFKDNPGVKLGSLVEARFGKGRWIYVGLGLWRQLPAGTVGAYQLLANLISLPKAP